MALVRAACPTCGEEYFPRRDLMILRNPEVGVTYSFTCERTGEVVVGRAAKLAVNLLEVLGAVRDWETPAEMREPKVGPPFNSEDVLRFHNLLWPPASRC